MSKCVIGIPHGASINGLPVLEELALVELPAVVVADDVAVVVEVVPVDVTPEEVTVLVADAEVAVTPGPVWVVDPTVTPVGPAISPPLPLP